MWFKVSTKDLRSVFKKNPKPSIFTLLVPQKFIFEPCVALHRAWNRGIEETIRSRPWLLRANRPTLTRNTILGGNQPTVVFLWYLWLILLKFYKYELKPLYWWLENLKEAKSPLRAPSLFISYLWAIISSLYYFYIRHTALGQPVRTLIETCESQFKLERAVGLSLVYNKSFFSSRGTNLLPFPLLSFQYCSVSF